MNRISLTLMLAGTLAAIDWLLEQELCAPTDHPADQQDQ